MTKRDCEQDLPLAISIMGPTASGKTQLALALCEQLDCEIVSVDSALIYQQMDIGTAKPSEQELASVPHHLINIIDPSQSYSVANFRQDALDAMGSIVSRGRVPLLVGGTMMYFKSLLEGLSPLPAADEGVRKALQQLIDQHGLAALHEQLQQIDPVSAKRIHQNDPQRLMRAMEVHQITGKSLTELTEQTSAKIPYRVKEFAIIPQDRAILHERIESRFNAMLAAGFEQEVSMLKSRQDLHLDLPSMRCVGYRQMWQYLDNVLSYSEMKFKGVAATRQLAKRQLTWLRSWPNMTILDGVVKDDLTRITKLGNTE